MKKITFFLLALLFTNLSFGQNLQNANWCFGTHAKVRFSPPPPFPSICSIDWEPGATTDVASVSDINGQLLFYTNGITVWGKNNIPMPNGTQLYGSANNAFCMQNIAIVPKPGHDGIYYIFTVGFGNPSPAIGHGGLHYSVVDMCLNGGNGDIIPGLKNITLNNHNGIPIDFDYSTNTGLRVAMGMITTTLNNTGDQVWLVFAPRFDEGGIARRWIYSYLISDIGINGLPDGTSTNPTQPTLLDNANYPGDPLQYWFGQIKISPNKAYLCEDGTMAVNLYNYNSQNGSVSFNSQLYAGTVNVDNSGYGLEFSPNSQFVYFSAIVAINQSRRGETISDDGDNIITRFMHIYQRGVDSDSNVLAAKYQISDLNSINPIPVSEPQGLQLAIDNKIYVGVIDISDPSSQLAWLGAIQQPDLAYPACNFNLHELHLFTSSHHQGNLPQWVHQTSNTPNPTPCQQPTGLWVWMHGDNTVLQPSVYGTKGVPASTNKPGYRTGSATWTDLNGNLWLFGGSRVFGNGQHEEFNDLWKYDANPTSPTYNQWTWMNGDNIPGQPGVYGFLGFPSPGNKPGSRTSAATWVDGSGNLWMFGGGHTTQGFYYFNDLWKYDPNPASLTYNQWTWVSGDNIANQVGVYGTQGVFAPGNKPGGREDAKGWVDINGHFWLWGGAGIAYSSNSYTVLNDLWEYNSGQWRWMKGVAGSLYNSQPLASFGFQGFESPTNTPAGQWYPGVTWTDNDKNFWLFGGMTYIGGSQIYGYSNALWKFNVSTTNWMWVSGDNTPDQPGVYGTQGIAAPGNKPGARSSLVSWKDPSNNFWLFGGNGASDLWKYDLGSGWWTWISGAALPATSIVFYGTQGIGTPLTTPGQRTYSVSWTGNDGNFWLFGGHSNDFRNDLWKYTGNCIGPNCRPSMRVEQRTIENNFSKSKETNNNFLKKEEKIYVSGISLMEVYNSSGQLIKTINNNVGLYEILNAGKISGILPGLYFIRVVKKDNTFQTLKKYLH